MNSALCILTKLFLQRLTCESGQEILHRYRGRLQSSLVTIRHSSLFKPPPWLHNGRTCPNTMKNE